MSSDDEKKPTNEVREDVDDDFVKRLQNLECPFTWEMDEIDGNISTDYKPHDEEDTIPLLKLMRIVMDVFVQAKEKGDEKTVLNDLEMCDAIMEKMREEHDGSYSLEAVQHVLDATKCHALHYLSLDDRSRDLLADIKNIDAMDKFKLSTINGCRATCWSKFHNLGSEKAINYIRKALDVNEDCAIWWFILGKNLRRLRRDGSVGSLTGEEESDAFLKAYENSKKNVTYGIFVAQMYREARKDHEAVGMYEEIWRAKPKSDTILLRLALGFIQLYKLPQAKLCLDAVSAEAQGDSIYHHYLGKYFVKTKNYTNASYHLKIAAKDNNYPAARDLVRCIMRTNKSYNATDYLMNLLTEHNKDLPDKQNQSLFLDLGLTYLNRKDFNKAVEYLAKAVAADPQSQSLMEFYSFYNPGKSDNIYDVLAKQVLPYKYKLNVDSVNSYDKLKTLYDEYIDGQTNFMEKKFTKVRT